jgi:hypothetical protein
MYRVVAVCLAAAVAATVIAVTFSAFSGQTSSSGNTFEAAATFGDSMRFATGSYTGNGSDDRAITDPGFQPDVLIVKGNAAQAAVMRTSTMSGDSTKPLAGATALTANLIQSLNASGFTLGTDSRVNANGTSYWWMAFQAGSGALKVGSYTGNGSSNSIAGAGFSPEYAAVLSATGNRAVQLFSGMTRSFQFDADTGTTGRITSLDADGFSVGSSAEVNSSGDTYHYVAWNDLGGTIDTNTYTGTGTDDRDVTGVGFQPDYAIVRANDTATARQGQHRPASLTGTSSLHFAALSNISPGIKALLGDGFRLGTDSSVNASGITYHYIAFKNSGGGCSQPGSRTVIAGADSWIDQAAPSTNKGADSVLKVTSKGPSLNTRALVQFSLPALPAGCSLTAATLRLKNKSPVSGRTLEAIRNAASWTETGVTWNNSPSTTGPAATAATPSSASWMEWTVTPQVQDMYSGSNHGFTVKDATENASGVEQQFHSREDSLDRPELVVTFG